MSTTMWASAMGPKICAANPGWSGTRNSVILASFLSHATPETNTSLILSSSLTNQVPSTSAKVERTCTGTENFLANSTERISKTLAPVLASSIISS